MMSVAAIKETYGLVEGEETDERIEFIEADTGYPWYYIKKTKSWETDVLLGKPTEF